MLPFRLGRVRKAEMEKVVDENHYDYQQGDRVKPVIFRLEWGLIASCSDSLSWEFYSLSIYFPPQTTPPFLLYKSKYLFWIFTKSEL